VITSKPLPKRKIFPFNSLPPELKKAIYILALTDPNGIFLIAKRKRYRRVVRRADPSNSDNIRCRGWFQSDNLQSASDCNSTSPTNAVSTLVPNLLALSRQIFNEAQPILYGKNAFAVENSFALHAFLANIRPRNVAMLTDLTIKGWGYSKVHKALNHPAFSMLASAVNLRRLHIDCQIRHCWGIDLRHEAKQLYSDGFHWLEAMGAAKGKFDAAVDIIELDYTDEGMEAFRNELRKLLR